MWSCKRCTFINNEQNSNCMMCCSPKVFQPPLIPEESLSYNNALSEAQSPVDECAFPVTVSSTSYTLPTPLHQTAEVSVSTNNAISPTSSSFDGNSNDMLVQLQNSRIGSEKKLMMCTSDMDEDCMETQSYPTPLITESPNTRRVSTECGFPQQDLSCTKTKPIKQLHSPEDNNTVTSEPLEFYDNHYSYGIAQKFWLYGVVVSKFFL